MNDGGTHASAVVLAFFGPFVFSLWSAIGLCAQAKRGEGREAVAEVDPYTDGDKAAIEKAGYASLGPFLFVDLQRTRDIEQLLGGVPLIWAETEHFRLGSSLDAYDLTKDAEEKKKVRKELTRLKRRLPKVKTKVRTLDPWLRLHLFAQRLEDLYADFLETFGLADGCMGTAPQKGLADKRGPYLGMRDKFTVLLTQKGSSMGRFTKAHCDHSTPIGYRFHFARSDSVFFGQSAESLEELDALDTQLHYALIYGVTENMIQGFGGYSYPGSVFWCNGVARWFARKLDPEILLYTDASGKERPRENKDSRWPQKVRARVEQDYYPKIGELLVWEQPSEMGFNDHMMIWSRIDFLMARKVAERRILMERLARTRAWVQSAEKRNEAFRTVFGSAIRDVYGLDLEEFDRAWVKHVRKKYPRK